MHLNLFDSSQGYLLCPFASCRCVSLSLLHGFGWLFIFLALFSLPPLYFRECFHTEYWCVVGDETPRRDHILDDYESVSNNHKRISHLVI